MKVFLDANILIDNAEVSRQRYKEAKKLMNYLMQNNFEIVTSCDLITTIYYILAKIDKERALKYIDGINKICHIIDFSNRDVSLAISLMRQNSNYKDFEDTLQYVLAKKSSCDVIISNDKNFFSEDIRVYRSDEYLKRIEE